VLSAHPFSSGALACDAVEHESWRVIRVLGTLVT